MQSNILSLLSSLLSFLISRIRLYFPQQILISISHKGPFPAAPPLRDHQTTHKLWFHRICSYSVHRRPCFSCFSSPNRMFSIAKTIALIFIKQERLRERVHTNCVSVTTFCRFEKEVLKTQNHVVFDWNSKNQTQILHFAVNRVSHAMIIGLIVFWHLNLYSFDLWFLDSMATIPDAICYLAHPLPSTLRLIYRMR